MSGEGRRPLKITYTRPNSPQNKPLEPETPETPETPECCEGCGVADVTVMLRNIGSVYCDVCAAKMTLRDARVEELARLVQAWRVRRRLSIGETKSILDDLYGMSEKVFEGSERPTDDWRPWEGEAEGEAITTD